MRYNQVKLSLLVCFIMSSCAHIVPSRNHQQPINNTNELSQNTPSQIINQYADNRKKEALDVAISNPASLESEPEFLQPVFTKKVQFWIDYYSKKDKDRLERFIKYGERYRPIVESILEKHGLPKDLYYVGIVESGYQNHARSHADAVGPWQFIKGTATRYGLKVNRSIDERRNIYKSTQAAALYFQDLYNIFGSWELALSGYNAGEYGIIRRIRGANTREYYELCRKKVLPRDTRNYVPQVLAVKEIIENPKRYNIKIEKPKDSFFADANSINIKRKINLNQLSKKTGYSSKVIKALNQDILRGYIPYSGKNGFDLFLPPSKNQIPASVNEYLTSVTPTKRSIRSARNSNLSKSSEIASQNSEKQVHRVRKNESLYSISKRYGTTTRSLKRLNNIKGSKIFVGQKLNLPTESNTKVKSHYYVRKGDNLFHIAKLFRTKINQIKKLNKINRTKIFVGQKLNVPKHKIHLYTVSKGDYLGNIARKLGSSLNHLKKLNKISSNIYPGQKLIYKVELI